MICCKIITNYDNANGDFSKLYEYLQSKGKVLWASNSLFFSSELNIGEQEINKVIKKTGYGSCYVNVYDKDNDPKEDDFINGWVVSRLIENNYKAFLKANRDKLLEQTKQLDKLNADLDRRIEEIRKQKDSKEEKKDGSKENK